jgi:hypothetical protein
MTGDKTWGIIGKGWLATKLVERLSIANVNHWATTRNSFDFEIDDFPSAPCDLMFLNTPPLKNISPSKYVSKLPERDGLRIIFISSTSVYGEINGIFTESSPTYPLTANATWLAELEAKLKTKFGSQLTVIRPGGLIGGDRHPIYSLSGKQLDTDGEEPINLIHRDDLVGIIVAAAEQKNVALINAVTPYHPAKNLYYNTWAKRLHLPVIKFGELKAVKREIHSEVLDRMYSEWCCPKLDFL